MDRKERKLTLGKEKKRGEVSEVKDERNGREERIRL